MVIRRAGEVEFLVQLFQQFCLRNAALSFREIAPVEKDLDDAESLEEWRDEIIYSENAELSELSEEVQDKVCELILRERIKRFNQPEEYLTQWEEFCKRRVLE